MVLNENLQTTPPDRGAPGTPGKGRRKGRVLAAAAAVLVLAAAVFFWRSNSPDAAVQDSQNTAADYKKAISAHFRNVHGLSSVSYESFSEEEDGAKALLYVELPDQETGSTHMRLRIQVDDTGAVKSCQYCDELEDQRDKPAPDDPFSGLRDLPLTLNAPKRSLAVTEALTVCSEYDLTNLETVEQNTLYTYQDPGEYVAQFVITPTSGDVRDLKILEIQWDETNACYYASGVLGQLESLPVGKAVRAGFALGDMDTRGVACTDQWGNVRAYAINTSGKDGSVYAEPVKILQTNTSIGDRIEDFSRTFGEFSRQKGSVTSDFTWNGCKYYVFARDPLLAYGFNGLHDGLPDNSEVCTSVCTTVGTLYDDFDQPLELEEFQKLVGILDMYTDMDTGFLPENPAGAAYWPAGNSGIFILTLLTEPGVIQPGDTAVITNYGYLP